MFLFLFDNEVGGVRFKRLSCLYPMLLVARYWYNDDAAEETTLPLW